MLSSAVLVSLFALAAAPAADHDTIRLTGTVVDAAGATVPKAALTAGYADDVRKATTDERGRFALAAPARWRQRWVTVVASADGGKQQAYLSVWPETEGTDKRPLRVQLKDARRVEVRVADEAGKPVAGASVGAVGEYFALFSATTDAKGQASGLIPAEGPLQLVYAVKGGAGLGYQMIQPPRTSRRAKPLDGPVSLTLGGAAPVRLQIADREGKPLAEVRVGPSRLGLFDVQRLGDRLWARTDEKGVAVFDWLPAGQKEKLWFYTTSETHVSRPLEYDPATGKGALSAKLDRLVPMRGRALLPDGKPAAGIAVEARGIGYDYHPFQKVTRTGPDGRFEMKTHPNQAYLVVVDDPKWGAPPRTGFAVLPDRPVENIDFQLRLTTRVAGRVALGGKSPIDHQQMQLTREGVPLAAIKGVAVPNPMKLNETTAPSVWRSTMTDDDGRYEFFLGPGKYQLRGPREEKPRQFEVKDEKEITIDFNLARPEKGRLAGVVVAGDPPRPIEGARVAGVCPDDRSSRHMTARTDKAGRFDLTRGPSKAVLHVRSRDGQLAGVVEVAPEATAVTIPLRPVGRARGRIVDREGNPVAWRRIQYGVGIPTAGGGTLHTASLTAHVDTDGQGNFTLENLVVGQRCDVNVTLEPGHSWQTVRRVVPKDEKPLDLGDLVLLERQSLEQRIAAAFRSKQTARERFAAAVREARLSRQHVLVVFADPANAATKEFFQLRFEDKDVRRALDPYRVVAISPAEGRELAKQLGVGLEKEGTPRLHVYDAEEKNLASSGPQSREGLPRFLAAHAPSVLDAKKVLADALAQAKREKKRVLVQETATWCGPCWALSRFLDRHRNLWAKDYVWVKIDHRWTHADTVMDGIRKGARGGIPWTAILDADGKVLATSNDAEGQNVGFPSEKPGIDHFVEMIKKTAIRLKDDDVAKLRLALEKK